MWSCCALAAPPLAGRDPGVSACLGEKRQKPKPVKGLARGATRALRSHNDAKPYVPGGARVVPRATGRSGRPMAGWSAEAAGAKVSCTSSPSILEPKQAAA